MYYYYYSIYLYTIFFLVCLFFYRYVLHGGIIINYCINWLALSFKPLAYCISLISLMLCWWQCITRGLLKGPCDHIFSKVMVHILASPAFFSEWNLVWKLLSCDNRWLFICKDDVTDGFFNVGHLPCHLSKFHSLKKAMGYCQKLWKSNP